MEQKKSLKLARMKFKELVGGLIDIKKNIFSHAAEFDKIMDNFRHILKPQQVGQFLIWLETVSFILLSIFALEKEQRELKFIRPLGNKAY